MIDAIPAERQIVLPPDLFLGLWPEKAAGRKLTIWAANWLSQRPAQRLHVTPSARQLLGCACEQRNKRR
jgi:hypothetical protein